MDGGNGDPLVAPTTSGADAPSSSSSTAADTARTKCKHCGMVFESRNKLFIHVSDGCPSLGPPSSKMKGKRKRAAAAVAVAPLAATTLMVDSKEGDGAASTTAEGGPSELSLAESDGSSASGESSRHPKRSRRSRAPLSQTSAPGPAAALQGEGGSGEMVNSALRAPMATSSASPRQRSNLVDALDALRDSSVLLTMMPCRGSYSLRGLIDKISSVEHAGMMLQPVDRALVRIASDDASQSSVHSLLACTIAEDIHAFIERASRSSAQPAALAASRK